MIVPEIRRLHSPDAQNLSTYSPGETDCFSILVQVMVGPAGAAGEETFDIVVCTPTWIAKRLLVEPYLLGRHYLIVPSYDYEQLQATLSYYISQASANTWNEVARRIGRIGKWEFEDYDSD